MRAYARARIRARIPSRRVRAPRPALASRQLGPERGERRGRGLARDTHLAGRGVQLRLARARGLGLRGQLIEFARQLDPFVAQPRQRGAVLADLRLELVGQAAKMSQVPARSRRGERAAPRPWRPLRASRRRIPRRVSCVRSSRRGIAARRSRPAASPWASSSSRALDSAISRAISSSRTRACSCWPRAVAISLSTRSTALRRSLIARSARERLSRASLSSRCAVSSTARAASKAARSDAVSDSACATRAAASSSAGASSSAAVSSPAVVARARRRCRPR